jgi:hypothetical protein
MNRSTTGNILFSAVKALIVAVFKLCAITIAWVLKMIGILCTKLGEAIEKMLLKHSS